MDFSDELVTGLESLSPEGRRLFLALVAEVCGAVVGPHWPELASMVRDSIEFGWTGTVAELKSVVRQLKEEIDERSETRTNELPDTLAMAGLCTVGGALDVMSGRGGPDAKDTLQVLSSAVGVFSYPVQYELGARDPSSKAVDRLRRALKSAPVQRFYAALEEAVAIIKNGGGRDELRSISFQ